MHGLSLSALAAGLVLAASPFLQTPPHPPRLSVSVTNPLPRARASETVQVPLSTLGGMPAGDLARLAVADSATGQPVLSQPVDADGDGSFDEIVFQADFAASQARMFTLRPGERQPPRKEDFRVYGRFVRERFDDFAWENDRVAHRMYGPALEHWEKEPLASSAVDVWCKRTRRLVINDWYMVDDYHRDHGEGADLYSAGKTRGCGGSGLFREGRLHTSLGFRTSRVLAAGPIRLVFELTYAGWDAGGVRVSEKKRITLDAGSNLNRLESAYTVEGTGPVSWAAGIKKAAGASVRTDLGRGIVRTWEPMKEGNGHLGCGVLVAPEFLSGVAEADGNVLAVSKAVESPAMNAVYWAGSGWDKSGDFAGPEDWDRYLDVFVERLRSPLRVEVLKPGTPAP